MANIRTCNKHNIIACVEKTEHNADFHQIIDFLAGCSINYSLLVDPDLIGPWLQQFWTTTSLKVINDVPHIRAMVVTALAAEEEHSTSPHSRAASSARDAQGTPPQSAAHSQGTAEVQSAAHSQGTAEVQGTASFHGTAEAQDTDHIQGTDNSQGTANLQGTAASPGTAAIPKSPNDYTPTDASQTSGGDEGLLDLYALNREVRRLKKQTLSQRSNSRNCQKGSSQWSNITLFGYKERILRKEEGSKERSKGRRCLQSNWGGI
ncbi:hypothetical protein Tco_0871905, partial [Tanacetum coccineum]